MACINEENKKVAFATLGCKLNYSESSYISKKFAAAGYRIVEDTEFADVYVVNTCTVTEHADKKCRNIIRRLHKINKDAIIAVIGCYAQLKPEEIAAIEGVSIVLGAAEKGNVLDFVESRLASMQASSGSLSGQHAAHSDAGVPENGAFAAANPCSCGAAASSCQPLSSTLVWDFDSLSIFTGQSDTAFGSVEREECEASVAYYELYRKQASDDEYVLLATLEEKEYEIFSYRSERLYRKPHREKAAGRGTGSLCS